MTGIFVLWAWPNSGRSKCLIYFESPDRHMPMPPGHLALVVDDDTLFHGSKLGTSAGWGGGLLTDTHDTTTWQVVKLADMTRKQKLRAVKLTMDWAKR
jgi:hypothetical protein